MRRAGFGDSRTGRRRWIGTADRDFDENVRFQGSFNYFDHSLRNGRGGGLCQRQGAGIAMSETPALKTSDAVPLPRSAFSEALTLKNLVILSVVVSFFVWSYCGAEIHLSQLFSRDSFEQIGIYVKKLFPPDFSAAVIHEAIKGTIETFAISFMGTLMAVVIALAIVFFASRNLIFSGLLYEMEPKRGWRRVARMAP